MTHIYCFALRKCYYKTCGKETKQLRKREKKMETSCLFDKRENTITEKRKKMWKRRSYLRKERKQLLKRKKTCGNVPLICGKGTKQLRKRERKNVETPCLCTEMKQNNCGKEKTCGNVMFKRERKTPVKCICVNCAQIKCIVIYTNKRPYYLWSSDNNLT